MCIRDSACTIFNGSLPELRCLTLNTCDMISATEATEFRTELLRTSCVQSRLPSPLEEPRVTFPACQGHYAALHGDDSDDNYHGMDGFSDSASDFDEDYDYLGRRRNLDYPYEYCYRYKDPD